MPLQEHEIPIVVIIDDLDSFDRDIHTAVNYGNTSSGTVDVFTDLAIYDITYVDLIDTLLEFNTRNISLALVDILDDVRSSLLLALGEDTLTSMLLAQKNSYATPLEVELFLSLYLQKALEDVKVTLRITIGTIPKEDDTEVEIYISGVRHYSCSSDVYCSTLATLKEVDTDIRQELGRILGFEADIYSSGLRTKGITTYIYSTAVSNKNIDTDLEMALGRLWPTEVDIFSTAVDVTGTTQVDFKTRSLITGDFFLERDKFTTVSSIAWVDIVDYLYDINVDNTYLSVDGVQASGVYFTDIPNGKRLYYDPLDDFYSKGVITYSVHTENVMGEVENKNFYLLYGYDVQLNEVVDWGVNNKVVVRIVAQNLAFCVNTESKAFSFSTVDFESINLNCIIRPVVFTDLAVQIFPQSTTFFYGKTYTVKLQNVKDFSGNIMQDVEYTFTVEDPLS